MIGWIKMGKHWIGFEYLNHQVESHVIYYACISPPSTDDCVDLVGTPYPDRIPACSNKPEFP